MNRIAELRAKKGWSQQDLADRLDTTAVSVGRYEKEDSRLNLPLLRRLAKIFETKVVSLIGDGGGDDSLVEVGGTEFVRIPVHDVRFACGPGSNGDISNHEEDPVDFYMLSLSFLRGLTNAPIDMISILQSDGDSMEPTIKNRDWVVVDRTRTRLTNPGIYVLNFEGDGIMKRASQHLETGVVTLTSDNPKYENQIIKKPDRLRVVGRVLLSIHRH